MDQVLITTRRFFPVSCHLLDNLSELSQLPQRQKMAHASLCSNQSRSDEYFLMLIQIRDRLIMAWKTYRGFP